MNRFAAALLPLTFLALPACTASSAPAESADLVIRNVNVVDVEAGRILPGRTVAIQDGWITDILEEAGAEADAIAARVVDGTDRYLIPGLWDMHVHFRGGEDLAAENRALLPLYIANGVTTVRDGGGDITEHVLEWRREIAAMDLVGPRILTSGPKLDGPSGGWDGSIRLTEPREVPAAIDSLQALGADYVKIYDGTVSRDVYLAIIEETERRDMIVTGHMPMSVRFGEAVDRGLDATEHLYYAFKGSASNEESVTEEVIRRSGTERPLGLWEAMTLLTPAYDDAVAERLFQKMASAGTAAVPTLHIGRTLAAVDEEDHSEDEGLQYIHPDIEATYAGRVEGARRASAEARQDRRELQQRFVSMVPEMHRAGVTILAGSDAGPFNSYVYPGFSLHSEMEEIAEGLGALEALRSATIHGARFMRLGEEYGQVKEGFRADLVLLAEDPLADIRNTRSISHVILAGETVLERADLEELLESVRR